LVDCSSSFSLSILTKSAWKTSHCLASLLELADGTGLCVLSNEKTIPPISTAAALIKIKPVSEPTCGSLALDIAC
jgi:hypothetical protein